MWKRWLSTVAASVLAVFPGFGKANAAEPENTAQQSAADASPHEVPQLFGTAGSKADTKLKAAYVGNQTYQEDLEKINRMKEAASRKPAPTAVVPQSSAKTATSLPKFKLPSERRQAAITTEAPTRPPVQARSLLPVRPAPEQPIESTLAWRDLKNFKGSLPDMEYAAVQSGVNGIKAFLALGKAFTNELNSNRWSSAHFAAKAGLAVARYFIEAGGNFDNCLKTRAGETSFDLACKYQGAHTAIAIAKAVYLPENWTVPSVAVAEISKRISQHIASPVTGWNGAHIIAMLGADAVIYSLQKFPKLMEAAANSLGETAFDTLQKCHGKDAVEKVKAAILGYNDFDIDVEPLAAAPNVTKPAPRPTELAKIEAALKTALIALPKRGARPIHDNNMPTPATDIRLAVLRVGLPRGPEDKAVAPVEQPEDNTDQRSAASIALLKRKHNERGKAMSKYRPG